MENQSNSKQDCGCNDEYCAPLKKVNLKKRLLFFAIVLAAGLIITVKLVAKQHTQPATCCEKTETPTCCSQSAQDATSPACCSPVETSACCSQPEQ